MRTFSTTCFLGYVVVANAYTTFGTTCAIPATTTNYVSPPNSRGSLNILWACLFTFLVCTWAVQHLNVPQQRESRDSAWNDYFNWKIKGFKTCLKWMLATAIAPEILLAKAWSDLDVARKQLKKFKAWAADDDVEWTLTHTLFANMGGFVIRSNPLSNDNQDTEGKASVALDILAGHPPQPPSAEVLSPLMEPRIGYVSSNTNYASTYVNAPDRGIASDQLSSYPNPYHLTAKQLLSLRRCNHIRLPNVTLAEINDKSKSDMLVRVLATAQTLWILVQIILRAVGGLEVAQLEIAVVAFSTCALLIYILNWSKPKGVQVPFTVLQYEGAIPAELLEFMEKDLDRSSMSCIMLRAKCQNFNSGDPIPNDAIYAYDDAWLIGFEFGSIAFGCIHVAAWNFVFPTHIEQILWWCTSVWCTIFVLVYTLIPYCGVLCYGDLERIATPRELAWGAAPLFFLYALARLFLLVEIFRSLCYLPPSAFRATAMMNVPHIE
ncbi:hypothetical protein DSL72_002524 [Monilinia vaccinii-corymbosi]|uniref:Uncharacterized protein n=1 Tax=Monilinia vaccinii-corymbosi TaxID=61207 RepID=A0A8A3PCY7_9HELO|nr:hypothetical protein DSL72_002524 [Monilinia vaccinii-corymbosi]